MVERSFFPHPSSSRKLDQLKHAEWRQEQCFFITTGSATLMCNLCWVRLLETFERHFHCQRCHEKIKKNPPNYQLWKLGLTYTHNENTWNRGNGQSLSGKAVAWGTELPDTFCSCSGCAKFSANTFRGFRGRKKPSLFAFAKTWVVFRPPAQHSDQVRGRGAEGHGRTASTSQLCLAIHS